MFGLSTNFIQSQVLPVSYTVSQYSGLRSGTNIKTITSGSYKSNSQSAIPSLSHQNNAIHEIKKTLGIDEKNCQIVASNLNLISEYPLHHSKPKLTLHSKESPWLQSFSSYHTFTENKNEYPANYEKNVLKRVLSNRGIVQSLLYGNVRLFKSQQSVERESLKQHPFFNIFKEGTTSKLKSLNLEKDSKQKLNAILSEEPEAAQKGLKLAFVEGYLAASESPTKQSSSVNKWIKYGTTLLAIGAIYLVLRTTGAIRFGVIKDEVMAEEISVTFDDVCGVQEAKEELQEIVEFLKNPDKFTSLGAELPKGALLVGPPGTGKTLLARAVAGEASVPFFQATGSQFDEVLVGQGARRVRDLFRAAKARAPCVIFIDEIDSVGGQRTPTSVHPYANQTKNQLLSEMDGFLKNEGVIILGATNRRKDLDSALLRPGRFDVEVTVSVPNYAERKELFDYYLNKIKVSPDVDANVLVRRTTGFTGADIKNIVNQAALRAAAQQVNEVSAKHLEEARDKVLMGPEKKSRIPDEEANKITACHEGGHAIVAYYTKHCEPIHKVTIIPRGPSLGLTAFIPSKEQYYMTKIKMLAQLDSMMGGRAAEDLTFGTDFVTSGASDDLMRATQLATHMVKTFGMSDKVGFRTFEEQSYIELSQGTRDAIDSEIKRILSESYERAKAILKTYSKEHTAITEALLKYETLDADDVKVLLEGRPLSRE